MGKTQEFIELFNKVDKKYGKSTFRLAAEGWDYDWQVLIATILSAQSRDELTIVIGENLFLKYPTLESIANAKYEEILDVLKSMNYNRTKAKHIIVCSQQLLENFESKVPKTIEELVTLSGVGRKTANLVITEVFNKPGICVDTHVHRICNVFGFVCTGNNRDKTETQLKEFVPQEYWNRINRLFVLWGKDCPGYDKEKLLNCLDK